MTQPEHAYYLRRAEEEMFKAEQATAPSARAAHLKLSSLYRKTAETALNPPDSDRARA